MKLAPYNQSRNGCILSQERKIVCFITDAVQWFGKETDWIRRPISLLDLISICAHKFHETQGSGPFIHKITTFIRAPFYSVAV